ncbi:MAG: rRNA maturation RNase YbeY [Gammaproteobacteria bacterium]
MKNMNASGRPKPSGDSPQHVIEVQRIDSSHPSPANAQLQCWVDSALSAYPHNAEIVIRIVDTQESAALNAQYRGKSGPTNILSFPFEAPPGIVLDLLGDLVICAAVVSCEAGEQHKPLHDHWAHIVIHGVLHLLGYDHVEEKDAEEMEALEIAILKSLHIANPYEVTVP